MRLYGPVERAWILSSTMWPSFRMYGYPTVMGSRNGSPVRPSKSVVLPKESSWGTNSSRARSPNFSWFRLMRLRLAFWMTSAISCSVAPSKTGVAT